MEQSVERPADPKVLLDILHRGAEPGSGRNKQPTQVLFAGRNDFLIGGVHAAGIFRRLLAELGPDEEERLTISRSRRKSCIQTGNAESPCFRSLRNATPCFESDKRLSIRRLMR